MQSRYVSFLAVPLAIFAMAASATTWDEPWQKQVIANASSFGLYEVIEVKGSHAKLRTIKTLAGMPTPAEFEIDGDYALVYTSGNPDHEHDLAMQAGGKAYLLPKLVGKKWKLPTPSSGIDSLQPNGENVAATYRISFHQTLQPADAYERVQICLFKKLHGGDCDTSKLSADLLDPLKQKPASLSESATEADQTLFFRQHVALESSYLLDEPLPLTTIEPFLQSGFFHQQISAVRALSIARDAERDARIVAFIKDDSRTGVARAMAIFLAYQDKNQVVLTALKGYQPKNPKEETYLPLNIMDPRVGTAFPGTLEDALKGPREP